MSASHCFRSGAGALQFTPDLMHVKHLGTDQQVMGSVLQVLTHYVLPGTKDENMTTVWEALKEKYQDQQRVPLVYLTTNTTETTQPPTNSAN